MYRFLVLTTVKPVIPPADSDTTHPHVDRIFGDPVWEDVNGYCKYLSKYPNYNWMADRIPSPFYPVAGLEFQSEHVEVDAAHAGIAATNWIAAHSTSWGVPATWSVVKQLAYTMKSLTIGVPDIDYAAGLITIL